MHKKSKRNYLKSWWTSPPGGGRKLTFTSLFLQEVTFLLNLTVMAKHHDSNKKKQQRLQRKRQTRCQQGDKQTLYLVPLLWIHASKLLFCLEAKPLEVTLIHAVKTGGQRRNVWKLKSFVKSENTRFKMTSTVSRGIALISRGRLQLAVNVRRGRCEPGAPTV